MWIADVVTFNTREFGFISNRRNRLEASGTNGVEGSVWIVSVSEYEKSYCHDRYCSFLLLNFPKVKCNWFANIRCALNLNRKNPVALIGSCTATPESSTNEVDQF